MSPEIPLMALEILAKLGLAGPDDASAELLEQVNRWESINRLHWGAWDPVLEPLSREQHEAVAKGLVVAEEGNRWSGGSVAAAIWTYRSFARKFPDQADALAEWMLRHSKNPWVPFGSDRGSAASLQEHRDLMASEFARRERSAAEAKSQQEQKAARDVERRRMAVERAEDQQVASKAREKALSELAMLSAEARLYQLAWNDQRPLSYYPVALGEGVEDAWPLLAADTRQKLIERAQSTPRGPWRQWLKHHQLTV